MRIPVRPTSTYVDIDRTPSDSAASGMTFMCGLSAVHAAGRGVRPVGAAGVETTTRHACADPRRLGSIQARDVRRRDAGTGPFDPGGTLPPPPPTHHGPYRSPVDQSQMHRPPSTSTHVPVIMAASSEARKT